MDTPSPIKPRSHALRQRKALLTLFIALMALPLALAPTRPIAVYGYLATRCLLEILSDVHADAATELDAFLLAPDQVERYRKELLADMAETRSGRLFAVVRAPGGRLEHAPIRTWNMFLPRRLPPAVISWLDRKEFPFIADEVALWQEGRAIIAMGHYHAFGGGPSSGDRLAQELTELPEVVVSNGILPMVYLRGELLPYGADVTVTQEVYRKMRALDRALTMEIHDVPVNATQPSAALRSFLAYLRDHRGVDSTCLADVASEIALLTAEFKEDYAVHFEAGYRTVPYANNPDKLSLLNNLSTLEIWCNNYRKTDVGAARASGF